MYNPSSDERFFDELNSRVAEQEFNVANIEKQFALFILYEAIGEVRMKFREIEGKYGEHKPYLNPLYKTYHEVPGAIEEENGHH